MSKGLPEGWARSSLKDLFEIKYGKGLPQEKRCPGDKSVYGSNGIIGQHDRAFTSGPTIVIGRKGSVGEVHLSKVPCWPIDTTYFIDEFRGLSPTYWMLYLGSLRLGQQDKSSAIPGINRDDIYATEAPVPPLAEQQRIVQKLEAVLGKVAACRARLARIPTILKRFRQAVLAAACSGRLTADWREANTTHPLSPAQRINDARNSKSAVEIVSDDSLPVLPGSWQWVRFGTVIGELRNGISQRPSISPPGLPILRISAARPGAVDLSDVRYIPNADNYIPGFLLAEDDLLFTRYNGSLELLGICGRVRHVGQAKFLYPDKLMRVRFDHDLVMPAYAELFFQVPDAHERIVSRSKSSAGQNGVSGSDLKLQAFALPPIEEQCEIVQRVNDFFMLADRLESRLANATAQVERLTQSVLAKAFRGELVPTEAELARREGRDYEPASALLDRVRSARSVPPAAPKHARRKSAKSS